MDDRQVIPEGLAQTPPGPNLAAVLAGTILPRPRKDGNGPWQTAKSSATPGRDGTATLTGVDLPVERVAAASERLDAIARARKAGGDQRSMDQLRADIFLDLLDGKDAGAAQARQGVVELTVPLTTLAALSQQPGQLAGWGPVVADIARQIADPTTGTRWMFAVTDPDTGHVLHHGTTRRRPTRRLSDRIATRDRRCRTPHCRVPARSCQDDHTHEHQHTAAPPMRRISAKCAAPTTT